LPSNLQIEQLDNLSGVERGEEHNSIARAMRGEKLEEGKKREQEAEPKSLRTATQKASQHCLQSLWTLFDKFSSVFVFFGWEGEKNKTKRADLFEASEVLKN
jgi:hypothetical protein